MITRQEYELLIGYRAIGYKWIARDKNKMLYVYSHKPFKANCMRYTSDEETSFFYISYSCHNDAFKSITWEDEKPTKIDDLIRDYESHQIITGGNNVNKSELIKEIEDILDDIGVSDYQLGECDEDTIWTISSITIREILSAIEKHSPVSVGEKVKATVPQFVADWIEEVRGLKRSFKLELLFDTTEMPDDVFGWLDERDGDTDILAKAWLDGYEVEKEKLYTVDLNFNQALGKRNGVIKFYDPNEKLWVVERKLTKAEIESVNPILMQIAIEVE